MVSAIAAQGTAPLSGNALGSKKGALKGRWKLTLGPCGWWRCVTTRGPETWLVRQLTTGELKTLRRATHHQTSRCRVGSRISGMRWPIETCFEQSKQYLGMSAYEVRSWRGWHHHMTLCILAHLFLNDQQLRLKRNASGLTVHRCACC